MKNLKDKITEIIKTHGKQTITQLNRRLHIKKSDIVREMSNFYYDYGSNSYSIPKNMSDVMSLKQLQLNMRKINSIATKYGLLFYYRVNDTNNNDVIIQIFAESNPNTHNTERCLYSGNINGCAKYLLSNMNRQDFFKNLQWSLSRPRCFHGVVSKGCDGSGMLFGDKTEEECEQCQFYRQYKINTKSDALTILENNIRDNIDVYFGTITLDVDLLKRFISKMKYRVPGEDVGSWFIDQLNEYFEEKRDKYEKWLKT